MGNLEKTLLIVNPSAGGTRAGRVWRRLQASVPELARIRTIVSTDLAASMAQLDELLLAGEVERLLVLGGDGSASLAAHRLLSHGVADRVALGLVPAGTGSDLARQLRIPRDPRAALERALAAEPRSIDAIEVVPEVGERRHVINVTSAGLSGDVADAVNAVPDRGRFTFLRVTVQVLWRYQAKKCRVVVDGEELWDDGFFLLAIANSQYFGKGMHVAPQAVLDDGLLDVVLVPPIPRWALPVRLPQFLTGRHIKLPFIRFRRARHVLLEPREPMPAFDLDGETMPSGVADFRVLPGSLRILV